MQWWDEVLVLQDVENFCHALPCRGGHWKLRHIPIFLHIATCNPHLYRVLGMTDTG